MVRRRRGSRFKVSWGEKGERLEMEALARLWCYGILNLGMMF